MDYLTDKELSIFRCVSTTALWKKYVCWLTGRWWHQGGWQEEPKCNWPGDGEYNSLYLLFLTLCCTLLNNKFLLALSWLMLCCVPLTCFRVTSNPRPAASPEPAYSLYSTDSEDQVVSLPSVQKIWEEILSGIMMQMNTGAVHNTEERNMWNKGAFSGVTLMVCYRNNWFLKRLDRNSHTASQIIQSDWHSLKRSGLT